MELLQNIEEEVVHLKGEETASDLIPELTSFAKQTEKRGISFFEKISKYWEIKSTQVQTCFDSIRKYFIPLIENFDKFLQDHEARHNVVKEKVEQIQNQTKNKLETLEQKYTQSLDSIGLVATEGEINKIVEEIKQLLKQIETEYRNQYSSFTTLFDSQPPEVAHSFETLENLILNLLDMSKLSGGALEDSLETALASSTRQRPNSKRVDNRRNQKRKTTHADDAQQTFVVELNSGAKYRENGPLVIIPTFEDPLIEINQNSTKGKKASPALKQRAKPKVANKSKKGKEDYDDVEIPEFSLNDFIPSKNDVLFIEVYVPDNSVLGQWSQHIRSTLLHAINKKFVQFYQLSNYSDLRKQFAEVLKEQLRVHTPKESQLELGVAQTRVIQIETHKVHVENHFRQGVAIFNKALKSLENSIETTSKNLIDQQQTLRDIIPTLSTATNTQNFVSIESNFHHAKVRYQEFLTSSFNDLNQKIESFFSFHKELHEKYIEQTVQQDETWSRDEKESANQILEHFNQQIGTIQNNIQTQLTTVNNQVNSEFTSIVNEFESQFPVHKSDVSFIEQLNSLFFGFKQKYDSLIF